MKKLALSLILALGFSSAAMADLNYGLAVGVRSQSGDTDTTGESTTSQTAMQFGAFGIMPISGAWNIRTGLLYTQRPLVVKNSALDSSVTVAMNYIDIPVTVMYKFEDYAGVFAGVDVAMNLDHNCSGSVSCSVDDVKSPILPIEIGAAFKFAPNFGVELYYESFGGDVAKDLKNYRAVGANLLITFD